ncbi:MAG: exonuclease SbcCD subunit D [Cyanobacteriota bacterium]
MVRFLHIADIHLGTNQYNSPDNIRKKDFFYSFKDIIEKYALADKVDFVLIAGDLFDKSRIDPNTLNQALAVLKKLNDNNIPVFAIEGNHDSQISSDSVSWMQFLGEHKYIHFLKSELSDNKISFNDYNENNLSYGCYKLNKNIRIIGVQWLGANTANAIPQIAKAIKALDDYPFTILMLHAGIEGYLAGYGTLSKSSLEPLKPYIDYLALGHIHKHYIYDNWAYNPGSLETCSIPEYFDPHGALIIEINNNTVTEVTLKTDYQKREFIRINVDITNCPSSINALEKIKSIITNYNKPFSNKPVIEVTIDGTLEFKRSELELDKIKQYTTDRFNALLVMIKYFARPKEYAIGANLSEISNRKKVESTVIRDMLAQYSSFKENDTVVNTLLTIKDMVLNADNNEKIFDYLKSNVTPVDKNNEDS